MTTNDYFLLLDACENGDVAQVKTLMGRDITIEQYGYALDTAAHSGHVEVVQCLLPWCERKHIDGVLINACVQEHTHVVACLVNAQALEHYDAPLQWAAKYGHSKIVDILIPVSNPQAENNLALRWAVQHQHTTVIQQLIAHSNCKAALRELKRQGYETQVLENEMQKQRLLSAVAPMEKPLGVRKM